MNPQQLRALSTCKLFSLELEYAIDSVQHIDISNRPHEFYHAFQPILRGRSLSTLITDIQSLRKMCQTLPSWNYFVKFLEDLLEVLQSMDDIPRYGCPRCY